MLTLVKHYLKLALIPIAYVGGIGAMFFTIFKEASWGFLLMVFLLPQPNFWYRFHNYPLGKDYMDFLFFSILLGIIFQKKGFEKTANSLLILTYIMVTYLGLWNSSLRYSMPLPISVSNALVVTFKNYAQMIFLYFFALNIVKDEKRQRVVITLISVVILLICIREYRNFSPSNVFSYDKRLGGPFEARGLGANEFAAFIIDYCGMLLGMFFFEKNKRKYLLLITCCFSLHPLLFAYSRGAYLATMCVLFFYGIMKKRSLLIVIAIVVLFWNVLLPSSVVDRISMTRTEDGTIEHSAGGRIDLWLMAVDLYKQSPIFGVGFNGYVINIGGTLNEYTGNVLKAKQDAHNFYVRTLCEQGIIGIVLFLLILYKSFRSGWLLHKVGQNNFQKGLGFGFMGCVISISVTNMFGDRWSYFVLGGYFWICWGLVDRSLLNLRNRTASGESRELGVVVSQL